MPAATLLKIAEQVAPPHSWAPMVTVGLDRAPVAYLDAGAQVTAVLPPQEDLASAKAEHPRYHHLENLSGDASLAERGVPRGRAQLVVASAEGQVPLSSLAETLAPGGTLVLGDSVDPAVLKSVGLELQRAADGVTVATKPGQLEPSPAEMSLDRLACVDRERIRRLTEQPLVQGPLRTRVVPDGDAALRSELDAMLRAVEGPLERGEEIDPAAIPLPTRTATSATRGEPKLDVLAIFAHPDDETVYTGGTMHKLTADGLSTVVVTATDGNGGRGAGSAGQSLADARALELAEARKVLGIERTDILGLKDFGKYRDAHRAEPATALDSLRTWGLDPVLEKLVRAIRTERPDTLLTFDPERDPNYSLHGHHQAMGIASMLAFHLAADPAAFPEQLAEGLQPWAARRQLVVEPPAAKGELISVSIDAGVKRRALLAHASQSFSTERQIDALGAHPSDAAEHWHLLQARDDSPGPLRSEVAR